MKKSLQDKLKKYGTMAAAVTGVVTTTDTDAQIVYTDLTPDSLFSNDGDSYNLDLNNDAIIDFQFNLSKDSSISSTSNRLRLSPTVGNQFLADGSSPLALSSGDTINATASTWSANSSRTMAYYFKSFYSFTTSTSLGTSTITITSSFTTSSGNWLGQLDKYIGLQFDISGQTHYGWVRLDVSGGVGQITIKDFAYNATPNAPINAGDTTSISTSIAQLNQIIGVTVFAANNNLNLKVPIDVVGYQIKLVDLLGREVVNEIIGSTSTRIDITTQPKGVYLVLIEGEEKAFAEKIIIQ